MSEEMLSYDQYLAKLPADRRTAVERVWEVVRRNMPDDYTEHIGPKFLSYKFKDESYVALAS